MIGYFTPIQEGELLYSAIARTADLLFPRRGYRFVATRFLGNEYSTFGTIIPNNCSQLLGRIPTVSGLDRASVLDASCYHALSPFLGPTERAALEKSVFEPQRAGMRGWFGRKSKTLKYCLLCAREDAEAGRPQIWRVHPNHPATTCCLRHKVRLIEIAEPLGSDDLLLPARWINLNAPTPPIATFAELHLADDIAWLLRQRSNFLPESCSLAASLRIRLLSVPGFDGGACRLRQSVVREAARQHALEACSIVDPRLIANSALSVCGSRATVQRYSLLAFLAGSSLAQLITHVCTSKNHVQKIRYHVTQSQTDQAKSELLAFIRANPLALRIQIMRNCRAADVVRRKDPKFFSQAMPKPLPRGAGVKVDWVSRDQALEFKITNLAPSLGTNASSIIRIFNHVGLRMRHHERLKLKLPRTWRAANKVKDAWIEQRREAGLPILLDEAARYIAEE